VVVSETVIARAEDVMDTSVAVDSEMKSVDQSEGKEPTKHTEIERNNKNSVDFQEWDESHFEKVYIFACIYYS
jgi:hypothetical protein